VVKDRPWNDGLDLAWVERLPLVRPVRLIASDRYDPHFRERDASGTDRRAEAAFDAFAAGLVNGSSFFARGRDSEQNPGAVRANGSSGHRPKGLDRIGKTIPDIMVSPTVVRRSPLLVLRIVGSLSDRETVRLTLTLGD
jgi:hypothetical protein